VAHLVYAAIATLAFNSTYDWALRTLRTAPRSDSLTLP
jgi:hypothetical protein